MSVDGYGLRTRAIDQDIRDLITQLKAKYALKNQLLPPTLDIHFIHDADFPYVQDGLKDIREWGRELAAIDSEAKRHYGGYLNKGSNLCRLPEEVQVKIMSMCLRNIDETLSGQENPTTKLLNSLLEDRLLITHICSPWRKLSSRTPSIWNEICLLWHPEAIEMFETRSGAQLLSVTLPQTRSTHFSPSEPILSSWTQFLTTNLPRIRHLDMEFFLASSRKTTPLVPLYQKLLVEVNEHPAPQLETFSLINSHQHPHIECTAAGLFYKHAPHLRKIHLEGCTSYKGFDPSEFESLVSLSIQATSANSFSKITDVKNILSHALRLIDFTFDGRGVDIQEYCEPLPLTEITKEIKLSNCVTITIHALFSDQIAFLFSAISFPSLRHLTINATHRPVLKDGFEIQFNIFSYLPTTFKAAFTDALDLAIELQDTRIAIETKTPTDYSLHFSEERSPEPRPLPWKRAWATHILSAPAQQLNIAPTHLKISATGNQATRLEIFSMVTWINILRTLPALTRITFDPTAPMPFPSLMVALTDPITVCPGLAYLHMTSRADRREKSELHELLRTRKTITLSTDTGRTATGSNSNS
ncbi:hypothetical protein SISNIDRAFT_488297 [Sistotremastrum niveocremeum HHB9708]|uniref:F-box domain-containing protein n=1 Tax=Sistotremastrum niveocremeum HHB9708 TaxID=1314777 RepID=A0A164RB91_9AGAM|nr:hypothetical protein SISNIDRAFT_488297 [Sistotremastrum niveocremeum HHB9708]